MGAPGNSKTNLAKGYVLGGKNFAAISAIEGLALRSESAERLERTASLSPSQRRTETIRAFAGAQKRG